MKALFVELPPFSRLRADYLKDEEYRLLQAMLLESPHMGDVIQGSGELRGESLSNSLHAQSSRLPRNLGALLMACWLPVEKAQQRVRGSLEDPEGVA